MALALSTKAKIAAATLTAFTVMSGAFSANAQQMAAATTGPNFAACDQIKDPARSAQCYSDAKISFYKSEVAAADARGTAARQESTAARQRIQVAQNNVDCAREVGDMRAANPAATDIARELVKASGRPAAEYGICRLRDGIRDGLALKH